MSVTEMSVHDLRCEMECLRRRPARTFAENQRLIEVRKQLARASPR